MRPTLVLSRYCGGFGNRAYLHVHALATAMEHGFSLVNLTLHQKAYFFEGLWANSWCRYPAPAWGLPLHQAVRGLRFWAEALADWQIRHPRALPGFHVWRLREEEYLCMEDPRFLEICRKNRWINLQGWLFRANRYVRKHRDTIRRILRFRRSLNPELSAWLDESKLHRRTRLCLHIRQGDFRTWQGGRHYIDPAEYARIACRIAKSDRQRKLEFWVSSDEPVDLTLFPPGTRTCPRRNMAEDFQLMTESDFILGGISTFSRAAAFLGGAKVHYHTKGQKVPRLNEWTPGARALDV